MSDSPANRLVVTLTPAQIAALSAQLKPGETLNNLLTRLLEEAFKPKPPAP